MICRPSLVNSVVNAYNRVVLLCISVRTHLCKGRTPFNVGCQIGFDYSLSRVGLGYLVRHTCRRKWVPAMRCWLPLTLTQQGNWAKLWVTAILPYAHVRNNTHSHITSHPTIEVFKPEVKLRKQGYWCSTAAASGCQSPQPTIPAPHSTPWAA